MTDESNKTGKKTLFTFPVIKKVSINNFSLYKKASELNLTFDKSVFCLAGANGLGKSTFLSIINYGLTGIVVDPSKSFKSIVSTAKFYNNNKKFSSNYFDGRVEEDDRDRASITILFDIGPFEYEVSRGFFDSEGLNKFKKRNNGSNVIPEDKTEEELFHLYSENLIQDTGLVSFDQYVFLQHFVFTFDEHHNLLFWDHTLMETTLYLFFGLNVKDAQKANSLRKKINQLGSNIRNFVYQKNRTVREVKELESKIAQMNSTASSNDQKLKTYEELLQRREKNDENKQKQEHQVKLAELNIADFSIQLSDLKGKYQKIFDDLMNPPLDITVDEGIHSILKNLKKEICNDGKNEDEVIEELKDYIKTKICKSKGVDDNEISKKLKETDSLIQHLKKEIGNSQIRKDRIIEELKQLEKEQLELSKEIFEIEDKDEEFIKQLRATSSGDLTGLLDSYYEQIKNREEEIAKKKEDKKTAEKELKKLERVLNRNFAIAEEEFMPLFQSYVSNFLGLDVLIRLRNSANGIMLVLEINNTERLDIYQLSESQRYFIDIGLRMALIQYGCNKAMLLIDTPEGSLDIAYESKAGKMFAEFAENNFKLVLTANINTSQLLIQLAEKCRIENMKLERMTDWTYLSDVQYEEDDKIQKAFKEIEKSLEKKK